MTRRDDFNRPSNIFPPRFFLGGMTNINKNTSKKRTQPSTSIPPYPLPHPPKKTWCNIKPTKHQLINFFQPQTSYVVVYFQDFSCSPRCLGKRWTHFDEHVFQRGWFNHQPPASKMGGFPLSGSTFGCFSKKQIRSWPTEVTKELRVRSGEISMRNLFQTEKNI